MDYYFLRVNGKTRHDNPQNPDCFVQEEPLFFKRNGYSNYLSYCFSDNIVRIGWPRVGDLRSITNSKPQPNCYNIFTIKPHIRQYLRTYKDIVPGSIILVPDRDVSGNIYICTVVKGYHYDTSGPYECSHRLGVTWDRDVNGNIILYTNKQLSISIGGWWLRAFHKIEEEKLISRIDETRRRLLH